MIKIKITFAVIFILLLSNLEQVISRQEITSGIYGVIKRGPIRNITIEGEPSEEPFAGRFNVLNGNNKVIYSFDTGTDGQFRLFLAEGEYTLVPDETTQIHRPKFQRRNFTVEKDTMSYKEFVFDTGIR